ncbi:SIR2 family protein [Oenococcus oeni]
MGKSRQILARQQKTVFDIVNLFTTNYDLFHERALERSRYSYTDGFSNGINNKFSDREFHRRPIDLEDRFKDKLQPVNPFFRLLKLHGSINWIKRDNQIMRTTNDTFPQNANDEVLISPTSSKFALTQNDPYSDLFREFVNILAVPNSVLFTSAFSFNDSHIANLVEEALDRSDFTLYAFVENPEFADKKSNFVRFINSISTSPNAFLIYPNCERDKKTKEKDDTTKCKWKNPPLKFEDFAYFMQPDIIAKDSSISPDDNEIVSTKEGPK